MQAAVGMRDRLIAKTPCCDIIPAMNKLSEAYIKMAYWDMSSKKSETSKFTSLSEQNRGDDKESLFQLCFKWVVPVMKPGQCVYALGRDIHS